MVPLMLICVAMTLCSTKIRCASGNINLTSFSRISDDITADIITTTTGIEHPVRCTHECVVTRNCTGVKHNDVSNMCYILRNITVLSDVMAVTGEITYSRDLTCPVEWSLIFDKCYLYVSESFPMNFTTAQDYCISQGGYLAVLNTETEFTTVIWYFPDTDMGTWINGAYDDVTDSWYWLNGETWGYDNFPTNNVFSAGEYLVIRGTLATVERKWTGFTADYDKRVLCELDPV